MVRYTLLSTSFEDDYDYLDIDGVSLDESDTGEFEYQLDDNAECSFIYTDYLCSSGCGDLDNPSDPGFVLKVEEIPWIPCETPNCYF